MKKPLFDIVVVAASAGGVGALSTVMGGLPAEFSVPVVIVQHLDPHHRSLLAEILERRTPLTVRQAAHGETLKPGNVYIAPPDHHVLVDADRTITLSQSDAVRFLRPAADLLFESAARAYEDHVLAVVLTGTGSDGSIGVRAVKANGGTVISQDPDEAEFGGMPSAAVATGQVDFVLPCDDIAGALVTLTVGGRP